MCSASLPGLQDAGSPACPARVRRASACSTVRAPPLRQRGHLAAHVPHGGCAPVFWVTDATRDYTCDMDLTVAVPQDCDASLLESLIRRHQECIARARASRPHSYKRGAALHSVNAAAG